MKSLLKKAGTVLMAYGINKLAYLLLAIVMARKLGVEGVGAYGFVIAITGLFFILTGLGRGVAVREVANDTKKLPKYFWNVLTLKAVMGGIAFGLIAITMYFYPASAEVKSAVYLYSAFLFLCIFPDGVMAMFQALQCFKFYSTIGIVKDCVGIITAILFLLLGKSLLWVIVGFVVGGAASLMISIILLWKNSINFRPFNIDFILWKHLISKGFYFLMQGLLQLGVFQIDIIILSVFGSLAMVGIYQTAYKIAFGASILSSSVVFVMYPLYASHFTNSPKFLKRDYLKTMFCNSILALLIYIVLILFSETVIYYIYGSSFLAAVQIIKILALAIVIHVLNQNNYTFLNAIRQEKLNFYLIAFIFIVNAILDLLFIKPYGIKGIATATVFCALTYFVISTILILKRK